jgi:hypothetical protein
MLSEEQFNFIKATVDNSSIRVEVVKDDLIDHFCCSVEHYMEEGLDFETAYQKTFEQVCPSGLNQIADELFIVVHLNKIVGMQKLKYSLGLLLSISISIGSLFKFMHWPGATILLLFGLTGFIILVLPLLAYESFKEKDRSKLEKLKDALGFASIAIVSTGIIFKIGYFAGGTILLVIGTVLFTFGYLPFLFMDMYKKSIPQQLNEKPLNT